MKHLGFFSGIVVALLLVLSMVYFYSESKSGAKLEVLQVQAEPGGGRGGDRGGDRGARGGDRGAMFGGGFGGGFGLTRTQGQQTFDDLIEILAFINLEPGFELAKAQKESLKQIRDGFKTATDNWRKEKEPEFTKLMEQARTGGREGIREKMQAITVTAPPADAAVEQVRQLLTAEQIKAVDDKVAARKAEQEQRRQQFERMREQGGQGGDRQRGGNAPAGGGNAPAPAPAPAPK